jgi:hypothetical protein
MKSSLSILISIFFITQISAQMPDTDVWLFKLIPDKTKRLFPDKGLNITNRTGYDNQPSFSNDGKTIYYVSVREDKQADVYAYEIGSKKINQLTKSKESEYSPVQTPDGKLITVVMVEADSSQRVHFINAEKGIDEKRFEFDSVGYYNLLNPDTVIYYKLTEPHSLRYYAASTNENKWLGNLPTRTFRTINRHTIIYGLKDTAKVVFYTYDFLLHKAEKYCEYPSLNEDVIWHHELGLIKSEGTKLFRYTEEKKEWELLYDLGIYGIKKITRFAFDKQNKYLILVDNL